MPQNSSLGPYRILKNLLPKHKRRAPLTLQDEIPFGKIHTDHMVVCDFLPQKGGWQPLELMPYGPFEIYPDAMVFHYGQEIFEGLKAYCTPTEPEKIFLFRPDLNAQRFANSAQRLGMEPVPPDLFMQAVKELVYTDRSWALPMPGSLYIRPTLIALDQGVSYRASQSYRFFVFLSLSKNYYSSDVGISVAIERNDVRAVPGGTGEAKCGGNYASALQALNRAKSLGAEQVLWLDGVEKNYVEEVGAMNVMFVEQGEIVTPALSGSILHGVTRASVVELARSLGITVREERIEIEQLVRKIKLKTVTEVFGCGTAAVISPITHLIDGKEKIEVAAGKIGALTIQLKDHLTKIQTGECADTFGWRVAIDCGAN